MKPRLPVFLAVIAVFLITITSSVYADAEVVIPDDLKERIEAEGWSQQWHDELYDHPVEAVGAAVRKMLRAQRDEAALKSGLVVHEWGSMQHHLGTTTSEFDLIGEDQADLPSFVKVWADQPALVPQVIRKPILYFYTQEQMKVNVKVRFPEGVLTQWYPDVTAFTPQKRNDGRLGNNQPPPARNGSLIWQQLELNPETDTDKFANVAPDHPWWHTARDTDATPVRMIAQKGRRAQKPEEVERFLFYRGAGSVKPMVLPERNEADDRFSVTVPFSQIDLRGVFLVRVNDSGATITHEPVLKAEGTLTLARPNAVEPIERAAGTAKAQLIESLEAAGLFPKEAVGLVEIWGDDMFTTPGQRLLYLMPDNEVDRLLPLDIHPKPTQTVRTLIAWVELSTPQAEKRVMDLVAKLGSDTWAEREAANNALRGLDRFAEAILRRVLTTTEDAEIRVRIEQILAALEEDRRQGKTKEVPKQP